MNRLERVMWSVRSEASRWVVEDYEDTADAVVFPAMFWTLAGAIAYAAVNLYASSGGFVPMVVVAVVGAAFAWLAVISTVATKYYFSEWTADVRPPEVFR